MAAIPERVASIAKADGQLKTTLAEILSSQSSATHPFVARITAVPRLLPRATLADVMHHLSLLHARRPGMFDIIEAESPESIRDWLSVARDSFLIERSLITQLVVALGPPPGRVGQTHVRSAVDAARSALLTLAGSERLGCAIGAAAALILDWAAIAPFLHRVAIHLDMTSVATDAALPPVQQTYDALETAAALPAGSRAVLFGFQTMLAQHRAFWDIIQTRAE